MLVGIEKDWFIYHQSLFRIDIPSGIRELSYDSQGILRRCCLGESP